MESALWVFLSNSYLSIVALDPKQATVPDPENHLMVRARFAGDIERVFPDAKPWTEPGRDYAHRAVVRREVVAERLRDAAMKIDYQNFKDSTPEQWRHNCYLGVWNVLFREQELRRRRGRGLFASRRRTGGIR